VVVVGTKTATQQATLTLHRQRELLMKMRIMQTNALRSLLYEFGTTFAKGKRALFKEVEASLEGLAHTLAQMVRDSLHEQVARIKTIEVDMHALGAQHPHQCHWLGEKSRSPRTASAPGSDAHSRAT
jgi:transposase